MIFNMGPLRKQLFGLALAEVGFSKRGFVVRQGTQQRLELAAKTVVSGYNYAIEEGLSSDLHVLIRSIDAELSGFFNEGVGMGLYVRDTFSLVDRQRFFRFVQNEGKNHEYMAYVGAGLASGIFKLPYEKFLKNVCPVTGCLIVDGIGFYGAYFNTKKTIEEQRVPGNIRKSPFFQSRFDAGLGRAVWFIKCGDPSQITNLVRNFPENRRKAIWSGVGLAATYAAGVTMDDISLLRQNAGSSTAHLAIGSILAAHARHQAGIPISSEAVVEALTGRSSLACHAKALEFLKDLKGKEFYNGKPTFEVWLERMGEWVNG